MRTVIEAVDNKIVVTRERLSKRPSGDAASRRRQLKHGWQPSWQRCGQASELQKVGDLLVTAVGEPDNELVFLPVGSTEEPVEIAAAREIVDNLKPVAEPTTGATHRPDCNSASPTIHGLMFVEHCGHSNFPHICAHSYCENEFHHMTNAKLFHVLTTPYYCPECGDIVEQCEHLRAETQSDSEHSEIIDSILGAH